MQTAVRILFKESYVKPLLIRATFTPDNMAGNGDARFRGELPGGAFVTMPDFPDDVSRRVDNLLAAQAFHPAMQMLARSFVATHEAAPRMAALFANQQRWLLSHATLAFHFQLALWGQPKLTRRDVGHLAVRHRIVSRNTAYAFFDEALQYDVIRPVVSSETGRAAPVVPAPTTIAMLVHWYSIHFQALDAIDGGDRVSRFAAASEDILPHIQPVVADALLASPEIRKPGPLYTIFNRVDAGGLLMDQLIAGIDVDASTPDRLLTNVNAIDHLAQSFGLSRAHTSRKLAAAEAMGGIGWSGRRGRSRIWISGGFYQDYARAQARKLLILDDAFAQVSTLRSKMDADPAGKVP